MLKVNKHIIDDAYKKYSEIYIPSDNTKSEDIQVNTSHTKSRAPSMIVPGDI